MLRDRKINTIMEPDEDKHTMRRAEYTLRFIASHISGKAEHLLDISDKNKVGDYIAKELELEIYNTSGDFDYDWSAPSRGFDTVICLEVLEHLLSPKFFLIELKKYIKPDAQIFITYPSRPKFLWADHHFHEYDLRRFRYLVEQSGYEIIDIKRKKFTRSNYFKGIRTPLRLVFDWDILAYLKVKR